MQTWEKLCVSVSIREGHLEGGITIGNLPSKWFGLTKYIWKLGLPNKWLSLAKYRKLIPKPCSVATGLFASTKPILRGRRR